MLGHLCQSCWPEDNRCSKTFFIQNNRMFCLVFSKLQKDLPKSSSAIVEYQTIDSKF